MAKDTAIDITFQSRDWEVVTGIIDNSALVDMQELKFALQTYFRNNGSKPQGTNEVVITSTEGAVLQIFDFFYGNSIRQVYRDDKDSSFKRIIDAIRLLNNKEDDYIQTELTSRDEAINAIQTGIQQNGRKIIMMKEYDNYENASAAAESLVP